MSIFFTTFADKRLQRTQERILQEATTMDVFVDCDRFMWDETKLGNEFLQQFYEAFTTQPRGFGYYVWKPYIIQKTLEQIPENSYLFYIDVGCVLYSSGRQRLLEYVDMLRNSDKAVLGFQLAIHKEKTWTKMDLLRRMNYTSLAELDTFQCLSGIILFKNNPESRAFVDAWRIIMEEDSHWRDDSPSVVPNDPSFQEHRHDQSVYSILLKQYQEQGKALILPDETWWHPNWEDNVHYPIHARRMKF